MRNAVAYVRVSTAGQAKSGLGLEAQSAAIARFAAQEGFHIVERFEEIETGKGPATCISSAA
jgi:DNA invertase Pin-like site-specific DNA recombinase